MRIKITGWGEFCKDGFGELVRVHPIIPFKHYSQIAQQIAWAEEVEHGKGKYCLANNNCEHYFALIRAS